MKPIHVLLLLSPLALFAQTAKQDEAAVCTPTSIRKNCEDLHKYYTDRFVSSVGFGYERMITIEEAISSRQWQIGSDNYVVKNIQLISLLKHDPPVVYPPVTVFNEFNHKHNPPVPEKKDGVEPRKLNDFEIAALKQLKEKKDNMVVPDGEVMVGALRAEASCIKCHDVEEGDLLGAFTYVLEKQEKQPLLKLQLQDIPKAAFALPDTRQPAPQ